MIILRIISSEMSVPEVVQQIVATVHVHQHGVVLDLPALCFLDNDANTACFLDNWIGGASFEESLSMKKNIDRCAISLKNADMAIYIILVLISLNLSRHLGSSAAKARSRNSCCTEVFVWSSRCLFVFVVQRLCPVSSIKEALPTRRTGKRN